MGDARWGVESRFYQWTVGFLLCALLAGCANSPGSGVVTLDRQNGQWTPSDGHVMPFRVWNPPSGVPAFEIIAVHGMGGRETDFLPLVARVQSLGGRVVAVNLRGMGLEVRPKDRGHLSDGTLWVDDLDEFIRAWTADDPVVPRFLLGESLGAVVVLSWLDTRLVSSGAPSFQGAMLLAPVVEVDGEFSLWQRVVFQVLQTLAPRYRIRPADYADPEAPPPRVTRDAAHEATLQTAPHRLETITIGLIAQMDQLIRRVREIEALPSIPVFLAYAGEDIFVQPAAVREFFAARQGAATITEVFYPEAFHLLLHDPETPDLLRQFQDWLQAEGVD